MNAFPKLSRTSRIARTATRAFTLIELLVVIVILAILAAVVITRVSHRTEDARQTKAITDVASIDEVLEHYKLDVGNYPSSDQGLAALVTNVANSPKWNGPYIKNGLPKDAWGHDYMYKYPGEHNEYEVLSICREGKAGTHESV